MPNVRRKRDQNCLAEPEKENRRGTMEQIRDRERSLKGTLSKQVWSYGRTGTWRCS